MSAEFWAIIGVGTLIIGMMCLVTYDIRGDLRRIIDLLARDRD
jgi:hypothetical protein